MGRLLFKVHRKPSHGRKVRLGLTATLVCYNEEKNIRRVLESVRFADEIVVVDSGSTDATLEIAREFTDRIFVRAWPGFSAPSCRQTLRVKFMVDVSGEWVSGYL